MAQLISVRLEDDLYKELKLSAVVHDTTITDVVRDGIALWLKEHPAPQVPKMKDSDKGSKKKKGK